MTEIAKAFNRWKDSRCGKCCTDLKSTVSHYRRQRVLVKRELADGRVLEGHSSEHVPLADAYVCERERAWRAYLTIRDGVSYHVEPLTKNDKI